MATLPWLQDPNYASNYPQYGGGASAGGGGISSLLQAIPSIMYDFKGFNTGPQANIAGQLGQVANAQMDTNNPLYQQIYGQQKQQAQQNLSQGIQQLSAQNRKLSSMGRVPLFDPERGGEQLFRGLTQGYQTAGNMAANNTQNVLSGAGRTLGDAFGNYSSLAQQKNMGQYQQAKGETGIAGILKSLFGL